MAFPKISLAMAAMLAPFTLHAQADRITGGQATFTFTPAFTRQLAALGVALTDLSGAPLANGASVLPTHDGLIDLSNGNGELFFSGGYQVVLSGTTLRVEDVAFTIQGANAIFSGAFLVNGRYSGRQDIFVVNRPPAFNLPLQPQNNTVGLPPLSLGLAPGFVNLLNEATGSQAFTAAVQIATATAQPVVVPDEAAAR